MKKQTHHISLILAIAAIFFTATAGREAHPQGAQNTKGRSLSLGIVFKGPREPIEAHFRILSIMWRGSFTPCLR
jgi:hypothetical protein